MRGSQDVIEFGARDRRLQIEILAVVHVGGADEGRAFPGNRKDGPPIVGMEEGDGLREREAPSLEQQVAAAQRPQLRLRPDLAAQAIGPDAGGVDDTAGLDLESLAADAVAKRCPRRRRPRRSVSVAR